MANTITSSNSVFTLAVNSVLPVPQLLQGYAVDDAFDTEEVETADAQMGVDGVLSAGYTPYITPMTVHFQAASPSIQVFETWLGAMDAANEVFFAQASITAPSLGKAWTFTNGVLTRVRKVAPAKKVFAPQAFTIKWEQVEVSYL